MKAFDPFSGSTRAGFAQGMREDPSKVNDTAFVSNHKELEHWLKRHPRVQEEIRENTAAFMHQENRYDNNANKPQ